MMILWRRPYRADCFLPWGDYPGYLRFITNLPNRFNDIIGELCNIDNIINVIILIDTHILMKLFIRMSSLTIYINIYGYKVSFLFILYLLRYHGHSQPDVIDAWVWEYELTWLWCTIFCSLLYFGLFVIYTSIWIHPNHSEQLCNIIESILIRLQSVLTINHRNSYSDVYIKVTTTKIYE